jgi:hypothetical protein
LSFLRPTQPLRRFAVGYTIAAIWAVGLYVLWIMPSPCMTLVSTRRINLGLFSPLTGSSMWPKSALAFGAWPEVNILGLIPTLIVTWLIAQWSVALYRSCIYGTPFVFRLWENRISRRRRLGLCEQCGYDLRGSAGRGCPECGCKRAAIATTQRPEEQ